MELGRSGSKPGARSKRRAEKSNPIEQTRGILAKGVSLISGQGPEESRAVASSSVPCEGRTRSNDHSPSPVSSSAENESSAYSSSSEEPKQRMDKMTSSVRNGARVDVIASSPGPSIDVHPVADGADVLRKHNGAGMEVACIPEPSLDVLPEADVRRLKKTMMKKLQIEAIMTSFTNIATFLRIAVNASADRAEPLIKIQNGLFEILKVCDSTAIMMQTFKLGANNILEKLRVAYLYILDGFPEFAKTDIEAISKDIQTMKSKGQSTLKAVTSASNMIKAAKKCMDDDCSKRKCDVKSNRKSPASGSELELRQKLTLQMLDMAANEVADALGILSQTVQAVERWYSECKNIVQPLMNKNFRAADSLPKVKQEQFWDQLQFKKEAVSYLCRWRALQDYCEDMRNQMRRARNEIEAYYTENLFPREAITFAWELARELKIQNERVTLLIEQKDMLGKAPKGIGTIDAHKSEESTESDVKRNVSKRGKTGNKKKGKETTKKNDKKTSVQDSHVPGQNKSKSDKLKKKSKMCDVL